MSRDAQHPDESLTPAAYWEQRYTDADRVWSGKVNATMADVVGPLTPGTAIDLGCGEGGDVLWLAEQGWHATGLDISPTAVERGRAEAAARGLEQARFEAVDLETWRPQPGTSDLVTASFFQSRVALDRIAILRRAGTALRPGGHLVITAHAGPPSWSTEHRFTLHPAAEQLEQLALPEPEWELLIAEDRERPATAPDGSAGHHLDALVVARRR
ncbi:bifunctional 2-polyprenyl-6-hydroxyphenol methylase/3-demethylubiquinol 3-O-methyltransferase UbiG [Brachybacterium sp. UMB0905]|uniref:class I SAM-dependent methyltransferase n=1 Tax=Brachybacterium sp. UMB0905 TaxID=2069310 RepID=UPI000C80013A|nr:class I SAM-dependent methyltransferase [Brachybacterium sp. UMB0905]PMC74533.1 class I SAM-dependent methyltransferase [Brachybacterium sp. UMB0905]